MEKTMRMYNGMVYGEKVSEYGLKKGRLDYRSLANIIGPCIFNGIIRDRTMSDWEIISGDFDEEVLSDYIVTPYGAKFLTNETNELVLYNEELDLYIWGVKHWGTEWDYVLTDIKIAEEEN